jgi:hypothetical protein
MKVIIAGSRGLIDYNLIQEAITEADFEVTRVIVGGARGIDQLAEQWAKKHFVQYTIFYPNWSIGKHAGLIRNEKMADNADALIAIRLNKKESRGTSHMIDIATKYGLKVFVMELIKDEKTGSIKKEVWKINCN